MTADQWRRISAVFAAAKVLQPPERAAYLSAACSDHPQDRLEIESLLEQDAGDGFDRPIDLPGAGALISDPASGAGAATGVFAVGQQVGNYRILRPLKPGGMGILYVAEDNLHREVVLKILAPEWASDPRQKLRLRQEAEAMARLQHPGVATVYAFEESDGVAFIVSEFVRGRDLRERLEAEGPYDVSDLIDLATAIGEALSAAHRAGIVHRDLKPENIMLADGGGVKLVDFGIARLAAADAATRPSVTGTGTLIGTPAYMSPEQLQGSTIDHRCDVFSLGIVLYEVATGTHPFAGRTRATTMINILQLEPPPMGSRRPIAFGPLETIVARCLKKRPDQRYASAEALVSDLRGSRGRVAEGTPLAPASEVSDHLWWWKFHQVAVSVFYGLMLIPGWLARQRVPLEPVGDLLFFGVLGVTVVSILLRLNGVFVAHHAPTALSSLWRRSRAALLATDVAMAGALASSALLMRGTKPGLAALLLTGALGIVVTLLAIEPATTRTAFKQHDVRP